MVNAIQRHATVVVQKSREEGVRPYGCKSDVEISPVVAAAVGGNADQVTPGTGIVLSDPSDLDTFGVTLSDFVMKPDEMAAMDRHARERIRARYPPTATHRLRATD